MDAKQDPFFCCVQETYLNIKGRYFLKAKSWEKILFFMSFKYPNSKRREKIKDSSPRYKEQTK